MNCVNIEIERNRSLNKGECSARIAFFDSRRKRVESKMSICRSRATQGEALIHGTE